MWASFMWAAEHHLAHHQVEEIRPLWRIVQRFLKKKKTTTTTTVTIWSSNPIPGHICGKKRIHAPQWSLSHCLQRPRPGSNLNDHWPMNEWKHVVYRYTHTHTHTHTLEYYLAIKKKKRMPLIAIWMDLEIIILSEVSQTEKNKYHMILLLWGILKNDTNELIYKTESGA